MLPAVASSLFTSIRPIENWGLTPYFSFHSFWTMQVAITGARDSLSDGKVLLGWARERDEAHEHKQATATRGNSLVRSWVHELHNIIDHFRRNMPRLAVFLFIALAFAGYEQVVQTGIRLQRDGVAPC